MMRGVDRMSTQTQATKRTKRKYEDRKKTGPLGFVEGQQNDEPEYRGFDFAQQLTEIMRLEQGKGIKT